jgi:hypothetical protein
MDTKALVEPDIGLGDRVKRALQHDKNLRVGSILWLLDDEKQQWLFVISTPVYEERGAHAAYLRVRKILDKNGLLEQLPLERVWIVGSRHPILENLRFVFRTLFGGREAQGVRLSNVAVDNVQLPEIYCYTLDKRVSRPTKLSKRRAGPRKKI